MSVLCKDSLVIPRLNSYARATVSDKMVNVVCDGQTFSLTDQQGLVWSLCEPSNSSVIQIAYQYASLNDELSDDQAKAHVVESLQFFADRGLISFAQLEPVNFPVDVTDYSHFFTSRGGLYAINKERYVRLAYGMFFGITVDNEGDLLVFDFPHKTSPLWRYTFSQAKHSPLNAGVIRRFRLRNGCVHEPSEHSAPVGNSTHHLVQRGLKLFGVNSEAQSVYVCQQSDNSLLVPSEIPVLNSAEYHHINSLAAIEDGWLLMQCLASKDNDESSVALLDEDFNLREILPIQAHRAHDILVTCPHFDDLAFWYCDSIGNHIRRYPCGTAIKIDDFFGDQNSVRGLSETSDDWVVGSGVHGRYYSYLEWSRPLGRIHFINKRDSSQRQQLEVPELPCCIIQNPMASL